MRYLRISDVSGKKPGWWNLVGWELWNCRTSRSFSEILEERSPESVAAEWESLEISPEITKKVCEIARQNSVWRRQNTLFSPNDEIAVILGHWIYRASDCLETESFLYDCAKQLKKRIPWNNLLFPPGCTLGQWAAYLETLPPDVSEPSKTPWGCYVLFVFLLLTTLAAGAYSYWKISQFFTALRFAGLVLFIEIFPLYLWAVVKSFLYRP